MQEYIIPSGHAHECNCSQLMHLGFILQTVCMVCKKPQVGVWHFCSNIFRHLSNFLITINTIPNSFGAELKIKSQQKVCQSDDRNTSNSFSASSILLILLLFKQPIKIFSNFVIPLVASKLPIIAQTGNYCQQQQGKQRYVQLTVFRTQTILHRLAG